MNRATKKQVMCTRKFSHVLYVEAVAHLERLKSLPDVTDKERLHIYLCPFPSTFDHYHVGHRRKTQQKYLEQRGAL